MKLDWLADDLRAAGLTVIEHTNWKNRSLYPFDQFRPVGLINHHTAGSAVLINYPEPPFYSNSSLERKCNVTIRPDGVVVVLNAGWAADSGYGAPEVLDAVRNDRALPDLSNLESTLLGNAFFVDIEVQHLGDGGPIVPVQRDALVRTNAVICRRMGWDPRYRLIGHREWAPDRKIDPRWDGKHVNPMHGIRADTIALLEEVEPMPAPVTRNSDKETIRFYQEGLGVETNGKWKPEMVSAVKGLAKRSKTNSEEALAGEEINGRMAHHYLVEVSRKANRKAIAAAAAGGGVTIAAVFEAIRQALG